MFLNSPIFTPSGHWTILRSVRNPLTLSRQLSPVARQPLSSVSRATYNSHVSHKCCHSSELLFERCRFRAKCVAALTSMSRWDVAISSVHRPWNSTISGSRSRLCWSASTVISYSFRRTDNLLPLSSISCETPPGHGPVLTFHVGGQDSAPRFGIRDNPVLFFRQPIGCRGFVSNSTPWSLRSTSSELDSYTVPLFGKASLARVSSALPDLGRFPAHFPPKLQVARPSFSFVAVRRHGIHC